MVEPQNATAAGLDKFLVWAGEKGELNANTAAALRGTCRTVLATDDAGTELNILRLDVESLLDRWENLNRTKYSTGSLATYRSRFRQSVAMYKAWLVNDPAWKVAGKSSSSTGTKGAATPGRPRKRVVAVARDEMVRHTDGPHMASNMPSATRLVAYEMPLRPELLVRLTLPVDLTPGDADRLAAFVRSLAFVAGSTAEDQANNKPGCDGDPGE